MEDYLQNLKSLRSQMNDIEEDAAKRSAEEQRQVTAIEAMEKDLQLVRSKSKRLKEETEAMEKAKADACCQIVEKQFKVSAMEIESSTRSQTLELLQQEMNGAAVNFKERRLYYTGVMQRLSVKLQEQQDWFNTHKGAMTSDGQTIKCCPMKQFSRIEGSPNEAPSMDGYETDGRYSDLQSQLAFTKTKIEELKAKKMEIALDSSNSKKLMEQQKQRIEGVPPALKTMEAKTLEEEHKALLADKAGETEFQQSLQDQMNQLKAISDTVKCQCGETYTVELMV